MKALAYDRSASSPGEIDTIKYIEKQLAEVNIFPNTEFFYWSGFRRTIIRVLYIFILGTLLITRQILIIILYFLIKNITDKFRDLTFIEKAESMNLYTYIPARNVIKQKQPLFIFTAHYDSFSALIPFRIKKMISYFFRILIVTGLFVQLRISFKIDSKAL